MAIKSFATNYLVADHDTYEEFMNNRFKYMKKNNLETDILFCNTGKSASFLPNGKSTMDDQNSYAAICKWHCMAISYNIWRDLVSNYVKKDNRVANYKKFVNVPVDILKKFKYRVEKSIENAKCDYNKRINGGHGGDLNACRYLAMFWTYLDLKKDCKTQRYFPDLETIQRAAKVFGYEDKENPFEMNGKFNKNAVREKKETKEMADTTNCFELEDLNLSSRTYTLLKKAYINTLDDILKKTYLNLICIRGLGKHEVNEVVEKLKEFGYEYKDTESVPQMIEKSDDVLLVDIIDDARLTNPLHRAGIHTVNDFFAKSGKELLRIRTFGVVKLKKVREAIDKHIKKPNEESVIDIAEQAAKEVDEERDSLSSNMYDELNKKYEELLKTAQKQADMYDELLKQKLDLDAYIPRLKDDVATLKEENRELKELNSNLNIAANPNNLDTITLLNTVLEKMKKSKMEYILMTIDGMTIDIHPVKSIPLPLKSGSYQIRSSEVR